MPDSILDGQGATLLMAIVIVAVALAALAGVFWLIRARASSTFIRGGKHRQPRLAVLDATPVDTRRRLVLIRRDDVEHLIMIGGPTDIVIESRIVPDLPAGSGAASRAAPVAADRPAARPQPQTTSSPRPQPRRSEPEPMAAHASPARPAPASPPPAPLPSPPAPAARSVMAAAAAAPNAIPPDAIDVLESARARVFEEPSFDEAAFDELTTAPAAPGPQPTPAPAPATLHNEAPVLAASAPAPAKAQPQPSPAATAQRPVPGDFESVLAAELSDDFNLDDAYFSPLDEEAPAARTTSAEPHDENRDAAPEVRADGQPSRDSLEAEMERLLGDLSRKP